jgi:hypothetical protein
MRVMLLSTIVLALSSAAWGDVEFGGNVSGGFLLCGSQNNWGPYTEVLGVAYHSVTNSCTIGDDSFSVSSEASVNLTGLLANIDGKATASTTDTGGNAGYANAIFFDTYDLDPPSIHYKGGVNVVAGDAYILNISGTQSVPFSGSDASLTYSVTSINGVPIKTKNLPRYTNTVKKGLADGSYSGTLFVSFKIKACPPGCSFGFMEGGVAEAVGNSSASFTNDAIFIDLPPGWTYTLASQEIISTPEPATFWLVGVATLLVGIRATRKGYSSGTPSRNQPSHAG